MSQLILVIEDDLDQRKLLERVLTGAGYRVLTAADGEAGIAAVAAVRPALILLDVMMPKMNGYQTCRALRQNPETAKLPIVMLTSKDQPADQFWAEEVGADVFLHKPVDIPLLLDTIAERIGGT
ncbi:MAG: response regulator [Gemmatimonadota bacterium]